MDKTSSLVKQALLTHKHTPGCARVQMYLPPLSYWLPVFQNILFPAPVFGSPDSKASLALTEFVYMHVGGVQSFGVSEQTGFLTVPTINTLDSEGPNRAQEKV